MMAQLGIVLLAIAIYGIGLLVYFYWQATRDRFYEQREERRKRRSFTSAGQFVPKSAHPEEEEEEGRQPNSHSESADRF